jgi:triacylglycerol lipase
MSLLLLHGLARTRASMFFLAREARTRGHAVLNPGYPSLFFGADRLVEGWVRPALAAARELGPDKVNVVTHSLGGILLRLAIGDAAPDWLGNVVLIAPPSRGSEIVDFLEKNHLAALIGPTGRRLGTGRDSLPASLPPIRFHCGIIAADRNFNPVLAAIVPGQSDGKVTVASTRAEGVSDYALVHATHTFSPSHPEAIRLALGFIETGRFPKSNTEFQPQISQINADFRNPEPRLMNHGQTQIPTVCGKKDSLKFKK